MVDTHSSLSESPEIGDPWVSLSFPGTTMVPWPRTTTKPVETRQPNLKGVPVVLTTDFLFFSSKVY